MTRLKIHRAALAALLIACCLAAGCGGSAPKCNTGFNYCLDPGGNGADLCCPVSAPYYCAADNRCHPDVFFSCATGKVFCSSEYN
jgi:hypothetical protein